MLEYLIIGSGYGLAAAVQPGPLQAYLLSSVTQRGWRRTWPACFAPLLSDGPIIVVVLLLLNSMPAAMSRILQLAGGLLLLYFAWSGYGQWHRQTGPDANAAQTAPKTLLQAAFVNLLNPNPYLSWSLVLGPVLLNAWRIRPVYALALLLSFYTVIVLGLAATILLFGLTGFLHQRARRFLILVSSVLLGLLGLYLIISSRVITNWIPSF